MEHIIQSMMNCFSVSEQRLQAEREISTPIGQTLYWDYYCYVSYPIVPTDILHGSADDLCARETVTNFADRFGCRLTVLERGKRFFHTPEQLKCYQTWLRDFMKE